MLRLSLSPLTARAAADRSAAARVPALGGLPQLDALRGLACSAVLFAHLAAVSQMSWVPDSVGTAGVGVVFALTGFLITRILLADRAAGRGLSGFYARRVARIFLIDYLTLAVLAHGLRYPADRP